MADLVGIRPTSQSRNGGIGHRTLNHDKIFLNENL